MDESVKQKLEELVGEYKELDKSKKSRNEMEALSEANVRADFIDPLFEILGWNIRNPDEYDREHHVRKVGLADVALKLDGAPVVFVEAKRFGGIPHIDKRGDADWTLEERQVILYAASSKCKWAILTNFEKFRVFNAQTGLTILNFEYIYDYIDRFRELLYLTRNSVETGRIDGLAERKERPDIDLEFLKMLNNWRIQLANDIYQRNKDNDVLKDEKKQLDLEKLKDAVQRTLDRLIIIRWAEDRLVLDDPNLLERKYHDWKLSPTYNSIFDSLFADRALFDKFNDIHDGKIFERGHICEKVKIGDDVLGKIIHEMCQRSFRKFNFDILGNTYETYLGNTLYLKDDGTLGLKPSMETRKEAGIYYTPPYVVDYIVKNTLGELLKGKTPEEVEKIKVLDPACGSGSFLIKAFDYFKGYYEGENERIRKEKEKKIKEYIEKSGNQLNFDVEALESEEHKEIEKKTLKNNIFGVDLDRQAAEIASVNLMLKALKPKEKLPPILDENIKVGNSLISGTEDELRKYFGDDWEEKHPFNWEDEFEDVFEEGGFDVVIGNPPYIRNRELKENEKEFMNTNFGTAEGQYDIYQLFFEKSIKLLKEGGLLGFITSNKYATADYGKKLRKFILDNCKILSIVDVSNVKVFKDASTYPYILILQKTSNKDKIKNNKIDVTRISNEGELYQVKPISINQSNFSSDKNLIFNLDVIDKKLIEKIKSNSTLLGDMCEIREAIHTGNIRKKVLFNQKKTEMCKKVIDGRNISRYNSKWSGKWILYNPQIIDKKKGEYGNFPDKKYFDNPKLLIRDISLRMTATYDDSKLYCLNTLYSTILKENVNDFNLKYILAIINSNLIHYFFKSQFSGTHVRGGYLRFKPMFSKQIPIKKIPIDEQQPLIELVDKMLTFNKQLHEINTDFDHYVNLHPRIEDALLKHYVDELPANDKEVLKDHLGRSVNRIEGKFKEFEVLEEGEWLVFKVGYLLKTKKGEKPIRNVRAFRCRFEDEKLRKFLYYSIKEYTRPGKLGKGNIYEKLLNIKIPQFVPNAGENKRIIDEIMAPFLEEVDKRERLEKEIEETDKDIDKRVYELYGLTEEEIGVVEGG